MAVLTELEQERQRWEKPYVYEEYPRMLYRVRLENGKPDASDQVLVRSDGERAAREREGYYAGPQAALDAYEAVQQGIAQAAAEAQHDANRLSRHARDEYEAADEASDTHLTGGESLAKRGPGRPRKVE
jgi:hypothetical protein